MLVSIIYKDVRIVSLYANLSAFICPSFIEKIILLLIEHLYYIIEHLFFFYILLFRHFLDLFRPFIYGENSLGMPGLFY